MSSTSLMSIHAFIQKDGKRKQFPLVFAIMSRKTKEDYVQVLDAIKQKMATHAMEVFVVDFEKAAWQAIKEVFDGVTVKGCVFHFTQAIWRHVHEYGLVSTYRLRESLYMYVHQLMALPFLPSRHIMESLNTLKERASTDALNQRVTYMQNQWIENPIFGIQSWSVFRHTIRTNNDVEGWHHRINCKAGQVRLPLYQLIPLLQREAEMVAINVQAGDLERDINRRYTRLDDRLHQTWDEYMEKTITTTNFHKTCGQLYGPKDN